MSTVDVNQRIFSWYASLQHILLVDPHCILKVLHVFHLQLRH
jgi:hypothetical protein